MLIGELESTAYAFLLTILFVYFSIPIAFRFGVLSETRRDRWHSDVPVPLLGGPALLAALTPFLDLQLVVVLVSFCAVGLLDDILSLRAIHKAILLIIPSIYAAWAFAMPELAPILWVSVNALNLLDHADGIAASASTGSLLAAGNTIGAAGAGATIAFLLFNWPPARSFLGDSGSMMLGALIVFAWLPYGLLPVAAGLALPLAEVTYVTVLRLYRRVPPWQGGTDHTAHCLLRAGINRHLIPVLYGSLAAVIAILIRLSGIQ